MPRVHDLHIDALRLILGNRNAEDPSKYNEVEIGGTPVLAVDVVTHPDNPKVNEFIGRNTNDHETKLDGDHLKWIEDQLLQALLESQTAGELAAWVMERAERGEWTAALAQAVVETLLGTEDETAVSQRASLQNCSAASASRPCFPKKAAARLQKPQRG